MCFRPSDIQATNACLKCGFDNPEGVTVCENCGAEIEQTAGYAAPGVPGAPGVPAPGTPAAPGVPAPGVPAPPAN